MPNRMFPAEMTDEERDHQAVYDVAEWIHRASTHGHSGCDGESHGCEGGPTAADLEAAEEAVAYIKATGGLSPQGKSA